MRYRAWLAQFIALLLCLSVPTALPAGSQDQTRSLSIQEQLVRVSAGQVLQVSLKDKTKLTGRLGALSRDSFELEVAKGQTVEKQSIRFDDVKKLKVIEKNKGMPLGAKIALGVLAGIGIFFVAMLVIVAASGGFDS